MDDLLGKQSDTGEDELETELPLCKNLLKLYKPVPPPIKTETSITDHRRTLKGPWSRLARRYNADEDEVLRGLFDMNLKQAFETHPPDRPIPRIAVMIKSFERNETYIPNVTNRLVLFSDATGEMFGTVQHTVLSHFYAGFVPNSVLVLKNVPIFNRSRFGKQLIVGLQCIETIFPELSEDQDDHHYKQTSDTAVTPPVVPPVTSSSSPSLPKSIQNKVQPPLRHDVPPDVDDESEDSDIDQMPLKRRATPSRTTPTPESTPSSITPPPAVQQPPMSSPSAPPDSSVQPVFSQEPSLTPTQFSFSFGTISQSQFPSPGHARDADLDILDSDSDSS